jgi:hypothetical protein
MPERHCIHESARSGLATDRRAFLRSAGSVLGASLGLGLEKATAQSAGPAEANPTSTSPQEPGENKGPRIDADFPGGNIIVERVEGDDVYLRQDQRDTPGFWFYWYFRVRGAAGRQLRFHFTGGNVLADRGPAVSTDGGRHWQWLGGQSVDGASFEYAFAEDAEEVRFCLAMPYQLADLKDFLEGHRQNPSLCVEPLARTKAGRRNLRVRLGCLDREPEDRVLLTCRHHSCEMMASWALQGLMEAVLGNAEFGKRLRDRVEFLVVPMVDLDGVEDGDQGKNRRPHDHNRDYLDEAIYPSVAAIRKFVPPWAEGKLRMALDMHCPYIRGGGDKPGSNHQVYFVGIRRESSARRLAQFSRILEQTQTGPITYAARHNLPWGQAWNTMKEPRMCARWAGELPGIALATTLELPYATAGKAAVTVASARAFGRDLARALDGFLLRLDEQRSTGDGVR